MILPLIQEGQLSVSDKNAQYWLMLRGLSLFTKGVVR